NQWQIHLIPGSNGAYFALQPNGIQRFDFESDHAAAATTASWDWSSNPFTPYQVDDATLAGKYLVAIYEPGPPRGAQQPETPRVKLGIDCLNPASAYIELQHKALVDPSGITDFRLVDGGLYYLSGDGRLHFLPGGAR